MGTISFPSIHPNHYAFSRNHTEDEQDAPVPADAKKLGQHFHPFTFEKVPPFWIPQQKPLAPKCHLILTT